MIGLSIGLNEFKEHPKNPWTFFYDGTMASISYTKIDAGYVIVVYGKTFGKKEYWLKTTLQTDLEKAINFCISDVDKNMRQYMKDFKKEKGKIIRKDKLVKLF